MIYVPLMSDAGGSTQTGTHGHSAHNSVPLGHSSYHSSGTTAKTNTTPSTHNSHMSESTTYSRYGNSKIYHPGVTRSTAAGNNQKNATSTKLDANKALEKKKAEASKKKAQTPEINSVNRLISPPKAKPKKPSGPFVTQ